MNRNLLTCFMLVAFMSVNVAFAQTRSVTGKVTGSDDGLPLPGVNILIKGTTQGAATDAEGNYNLPGVSDNSVLVFRYLGYVTQEITVGNQNVINIILAPDAVALGEVVVTAQGIAREKKSLGYAIGQVEKDLLESRPEAEVGRLLRGKVAGVEISYPGGFLGQAPNIQIRGLSSATGNNNPLVIVDGVFYDFARFQDLDPNNIEDINILKGLSASTLYGQEGRNGVIVVTTKTGSNNGDDGDFSINFNQQVIMNQVSNLPDFQNTYGQGADNFPNVTFVGNWGGRFSDDYIVPGHYATGRVPGLDQVFPELQGDVPYQAFPNNVNDFFQDNYGSNTSLNANGTIGKTSIGFSTAYVDQTGYIEENSLRRFNFAASVNTQLADKLRLSTNFSYSENDRRSPTFNFFDRLLYLPRNLDIQGLPYQNPNDGSSVFYRPDLENPLWQLDNTEDKRVRQGFLGKAQLTYDLTDQVSLSYRFGIDTYTDQNRFTRNKGGLVNQGIGGMSNTFSKRTNFDHNFLVQGNSIKIGSDIELNAQIGFNMRSFNTESFGINSTGQVVYGFFRHGNFTDHQPTGNVDRRINVLGLYGQAEFGYKDYLYMTLSGRNDWGSQVEEANRSLFYPSASVSFIPTEVWDELKSSTLNSLRVRFGYGTSAGYPNPFLTRPTLSANAQAFVTPGGANVSTNGISTFQPNPNLKPEQLKEFEAGVNAKLFDYKVDLDLSIYKRISEDQVLGRTLPNSTGFTNTVINAGRIDTKGLEAAITVYPIRRNDFEWRIINNFTTYETTVIDLPEEFINLANGLNYAIEGEPLSVFRLDYVVRDDNGNALINPEDGTIISSDEAGLQDRVVGDPNPDFQYTMINGFSYKNWNLSVQIDYTHGGDVYSTTASNLLRRGVTKDTEDREGSYIIPGVLGNPNTGEVILDENGNAIPNTIQLGANDLFFLNTIDVSENLVFDATRLRIREINLSYSLPQSLLNKTPFRGASFSFNVQNLWFKAFNFPEHMNFDPEVSSNNPNGRGFDTQSDPTMRQFSLGLNLTL